MVTSVIIEMDMEAFTYNPSPQRLRQEDLTKSSKPA